MELKATWVDLASKGRIFFEDNVESIVDSHEQVRQAWILFHSAVLGKGTVIAWCWLAALSGAPGCDLKSAAVSGGQGETEEAATPGSWVSVLIIKGTDIQGLSWAAAGWLDPHTRLQILRVYQEAVTGLSPVYSAGVRNTTPHHHLKAMSLEQTLRRERQGEPTSQGQGNGVRSLQVLGSRSQLNWWSYLFDDLPQHSVEISRECSNTLPKLRHLFL